MGPGGTAIRRDSGMNSPDACVLCVILAQYLYLPASEEKDSMSRIFVVDDQNDILDVLEQVLIQEGFEVRTSPTSHGIISTIEEFQPNLILLDTFIGEEDGREACGNLKSNARTKDIPIIMLSADRRVETSAKAVGADDFIPKPFSVFTLMHQIERHLAG